MATQGLAQILFTENRDFLLDKNGSPVKADVVEGKVVGLIIGPYCLPAPLEHTISLITHPCLELRDRVTFVYVAVERDEDLISTIRMYGQTKQLDERPDQECFADVLKKLPDGCLAVPFDDKETRTKIAEIHKEAIFTLAFIGPEGRVHSKQGLALLDKWGADGYPFDEDRIVALNKAAQERRANQNLQVLLVQEQRDDLISSETEHKTKVAELEGKIVALYFSAHWCPPCQKFTPVLASIYKELKKKGEEFEVVFISSDDGQDSFDTYFKEMPWLAVPFNDEKTRKFLSNWFEVEGIPTLIILDTHGKTLNTEGMELMYKYGVEAYPFTAKRLDELKQADEAKRAAQTLETLLVTEERDVVKSKYGPVTVASLTGKTVGLYFSGHWCPPCRKFTPKLKSVYDELKGRGEEFEVIFVSSDRDDEAFDEYYGSMPWLALPFKDKSIRSLSRYFDVQGIPQLIIIGPNGKTVTTDGRGLIGLYGADAFPFTDNWIAELKSKSISNAELQKLPKSVTSSKHEHSLTLTDNAYEGQVYVCDDCDEQGVGWVYHCAECGFDLHPDCIGEVENKPPEDGSPSEGEGTKPGYVCEGDVCRKV